MKVDADVIVIGAGIAGASAASEIAADASVVVLERERAPGYHATGRSAAYFAPAYGNRVVRDMTAASESFYRTPPDGFSEAPLINARDALFVARPDQRSSLERMIAENDSLARIDEAGIRRLVPAIRRGVIDEGLHDRAGGDLDVDAILQGYLVQLRKRGGEIVTTREVSGLEFDAVHGVWQVATSAGPLKAPLVVNAAGAWADDVARCVSLVPLGLTPRRRTALLIDPPTAFDTREWPLVIDVDEQFYFKPDAGRLLVSPADETPSPPCDAQPEEIDIAQAIDRVTRVADIEVKRVLHSWAGLRTFAPDKTFVVGFDPRVRGFFWLAGQGGYGVQSAPGMAQLTRHLLLGLALPAGFERVGDSVDAVSPARFL